MLFFLTILLSLASSAIAGPGVAAAENSSGAAGLSLEELERKTEWEGIALRRAGLSGDDLVKNTHGLSDPYELSKIDAQMRRYQNSYDDLVKAELDNMIGKARAVLMEIAKDPKVSSKHRRKVIEMLEMDVEFQENKPLYGTGPDVKRKAPYQNFFASFKQLHDDMHPLPIAERIKNKLAGIVGLMKTYISLRGQIPGFLRKLYFPKKGEKPQMVGALSDGFNAFAEGAGYNVKVEGRENIPELPPLTKERKVINIFAPTHRQGIHDGILMAEVMPRDSMLFMAPRNFLGPQLGGQFKGVKGFIAVEPSKPAKPGQPKPPKKNPVDVLLKQLDETKSQNVFIYPEGGLPTGILENMPVRENFGASLIPTLRKMGYEVNLIPITYENSARFMNKRVTDVEGKNLRAVFHPAVPDETLGKWEKYDPTFVNRYLRTVHMQGLETNERQLAGMLRPDRLMPELNRFLGDRCPGHFAGLK